MASNAPDVTDATFAAEVLESDTPVLVDFWAEWCPPCRMMGPIIDEIAAEMGDTLKVVKLDTDSNPRTSVTTASSPSRPSTSTRAGKLVGSVVGGMAAPSGTS